MKPSFVCYGRMYIYITHITRLKHHKRICRKFSFPNENQYIFGNITLLFLHLCCSSIKYYFLACGMIYKIFRKTESHINWTIEIVAFFSLILPIVYSALDILLLFCPRRNLQSFPIYLRRYPWDVS